MLQHYQLLPYHDNTLPGVSNLYCEKYLFFSQCGIARGAMNHHDL